MVEIIRAILSRGHQVTFIPDDLEDRPPYREALQSLGVEVVLPPMHHSVASYLQKRGAAFDLAILSRAAVAERHIGTVRRLDPNARLVFDTVDLHFVREQRAAELAQDPVLGAAVARRREQEIGLASRADLTVVVSHVEKQLLEEVCPGAEVMVIPTIYPIDPAEPPGFDGRRSIVFIGGFLHSPNVDAVLYFAREIFPRIRAEEPGVVLNVIGPDAPGELLALQSEAVRILGHVADVKPLFDEAIVSVAPLRYGAGVKGKVNHSMSLGVPAVVTSLAAEGMHLEHGRDAMIADDPESFAAAVVAVCRSRELWERLSRNGRNSLRKHFSVEAAAGAIDAMLQWAGLAAGPESPQSKTATAALAGESLSLSIRDRTARATQSRP
jgi:glycosyltransferase involved in cell wall biosynthesis